MKKLALILAIALSMFALTACSTDTGSEGSDTGSSTESVADPADPANVA